MLQKPSDRELYWLAGLLEGEGCFTDHYDGQKNWYPRIQLVSTDEDVVRKAAELLGGNKVRERPRPPFKTRYQVNLTGAGAVQLMEWLYPLMGTRRRERMGGLIDTYNGVGMGEG